MNASYKFGWKPETPERYVYPDIWAREKTTGPERLVIAPSRNQIALIQELSSAMAEPLGILYILAVPRGGGESGRYQCPEFLTRAEVGDFLNRFQYFLENDGRHHLWLASPETTGLLVYDNHNVIYAYGQLSAFEEILKKKGLKKADTVTFPSPHTHLYNQNFDVEEEAVLRYWQWKKFPLQETDDR